MAKVHRTKGNFKTEQENKSFDTGLEFEQQGCNCGDIVSESHGICPSTQICPTPNIPVTGEAVVVKIPVVLAEALITIPVIAHIKLEHKANEIKRIRKNVFIKQCHLIPGSVTDTCPATGILVVEGFVRKNIEYSTAECRGRNATSGRIVHTTVDVPFSCTTSITFTVPPVFVPNFPPVEFGMFHETHKGCHVCEDDLIGSDPCERNFAQTEFFNERVFCELVCAEIFESDIIKNSETLGCKRPIDHLFDEFTEKMVVKVTFKLLQNQQVRIESEDECY